MQYYIIGSKAPRPASRASIFADGTDENLYRPGIDLELSHWNPNHTPSEYKAGTSTETCLIYIEKNPGYAASYDYVLNNHLDVDGLLSVYVLVRGSEALASREELVGAAEMGDFWGWTNEKGRTLFLALTELLNTTQAKEQDLMEVTGLAIGLVDSILKGDYLPSAAVRKGSDQLDDNLRLLHSASCKITEVKNGTEPTRLVSIAITAPNRTALSPEQTTRYCPVRARSTVKA